MENLINNKLLLKNSFYEFNREKEELLFYTDKKEYVFKGKSTFDLMDIFPLLNKENTIESIAKSLNLPIEYITQIIQILVDKNLIIFNSDNRYFSNKSLENLCLSVTHSDSKLVSTETISTFIGRKLGVVGNEDVFTELFKSLEGIFDLEFINDINANEINYDFLIAVDVFENINFFKKVNQFCYENNTEFLKIILTSDEISVGPIFIPTESSCYQCWLNRYITNLEDPSTFIKIGKNYSTTVSDSKLFPGTIEVAAGLIKRQIINYFNVNSSCSLVNNEYYLNLNNFDSYLSPVLKIPNCIICNNNTSKRLQDEVII